MGKVTGSMLVEEALRDLEQTMTGETAETHFGTFGEDPKVVVAAVAACRAYFEGDGTEVVKAERFATMLSFVSMLLASNTFLAMTFQASYEVSRKKRVLETLLTKAPEKANLNVEPTV